MLVFTVLAAFLYESGDGNVERKHMIETQIKSRGIESPIVLSAMAAVKRHYYVPKAMKPHAYEDRPLPIGHGQTISQPYIVATMTEQLGLTRDSMVLEIGTGSGYQTAILAEIAHTVYTIEIVEALGVAAAKIFERAGYQNIVARIGDGYMGWQDHAPFDAIIVTAAPSHVPQPLIDQLKTGGKMIIPVGPNHAVQYLTLLEKEADGTVSRKSIMPVRFVPFTGKYQEN